MKQKYIVPVEIELTTNMDADYYGEVVVDCFRKLTLDSPVINLVKVSLGHKVNKDSISFILKDLRKQLKSLGAKNVVYVPLIEGYIEDIQIDHLEVV